MATVIINDTMRIENIDSVMGYRFFIAVNNPVVQKLELVPFADYYRGIYSIYEKWQQFHKDKKQDNKKEIYGFHTIPMFRDYFALCSQHDLSVEKKLNHEELIVLLKEAMLEEGLSENEISMEIEKLSILLNKEELLEIKMDCDSNVLNEKQESQKEPHSSTRFNTYNSQVNINNATKNLNCSETALLNSL